LLPYLEPQCILVRNYVRDEASDIYSLGVLFWEISSQKIPFLDYNDAYIAFIIGRGDREKPVYGTVPPQFIDLYKLCWNADPKNRPKIDFITRTLVAIEDDN